MRFLNTTAHGVMDYLVGGLLIVAPWLLGFDTGGPAMWVPIILGSGLILYSLVTNYELGLVPALPMPVHLGLDVFGGLVLAASPWLFNFDEVVYLPHLIVGLLEVGMALVTQTVPQRPALSERHGPASNPAVPHQRDARA